jgi:hypothetical protein
MHGNDSNKSHLHSQRNLELIKSGECLIPLHSESYTEQQA